MRSPEQKHYERQYERDTGRFKVPEAFTILSAEEDLVQNPPPAPEPYKLTPSTRRHKNLSFAILPEPSSAPGSRSPSPTGRVSPFRGRGFNPIGSRHASPLPSPPPPEVKELPPRSKIPKLTRRGSDAAFGEKIKDFQASPNRRKLNSQFSQSLTNISPKILTRPPISPRKIQAFQRLSPIIGSSPEPSQSQSSPKVVQEKLRSPVRSQSFVNKPRRTPARAGSRVNSRNPSREPSPNKNPTSPTRIPVKNGYKNVQAKVNSFNKAAKPKVPPKPQELADDTDTSDAIVTSTIARKKLERKESVKTKSSAPPKSKTSEPSAKSAKPPGVVKGKKGSESSSPVKKPPKPNSPEKTKPETPVKLSDLLQPSATTVVSTTTTTVTKPLKIEAKIDTVEQTIAPIVDGRVLSATSVSQAMNKMNDTVLQTQTLIKETGLTLSPSSNSIIAMAKEATNPALDTRNATTALPSVDRMSPKENSTNHVTSTGILPSARVLEEHVQNNMSKLISPEPINNVHKSVNDKIIEARTVIANDVKPIRITVKEKGVDSEVQSGNVRFETTNGITDRASLPPAQPTNDPQAQETPKTNICTRFLSSCKKKLSCKRTKAEPNNEKEEIVKPEGAKTGCFNCKRKQPDVTINIEGEDPPKTCWEKLKCGGNKVSDSGCFPHKRKTSWTERRDSILSTTSKPGCCSRFWRKVLCLDHCRKKKPVKIEEDISRRASMMSKMSKKKSLTPEVQVEESKPKIDMSLVEHTSQMKAAIPILPVGLAWFCLVMNCIGPGTGTILSGLFCLCIGIPRFSQKDGPRSRIGAFIIDLIIGVGQFFTVLFCLVGWGWSIWWGIIMVKIAKKHRKLKALAANDEESAAAPPPPTNHQRRS